MKFFLILLLLFNTGITLFAKDKPNIIIMIGDGMGPTYMTAFRTYHDNLETVGVEQSIFDPLLVGTSRVDLDDHEHHVITESAAAGTAMATGTKSYYSAIGVDKNTNPLPSTLENARKQGYQTAVVVSSTLAHATPASFIAHNESRNNYEALADDYFDERINNNFKVDILFGGGQKHFMREDRNLLAEFNHAGYATAVDWSGFDEISSMPAMAILANDGLPYEIDSPRKNRITGMTKKALKLLDKDKPFFLLVEGSQIDWCGHQKDIACTMAEMQDFANSLEVVLAFIKENANTLLVLTADHSTGGLTIGADYPLIYDGPQIKYKWLSEVIRPIKHSLKYMSRAMFHAQKDWYPVWLDMTSQELSAEEKASFAKVIIGYEVPADITINQLTDDHRPQLRAMMTTMQKIINGRSSTGWTTAGHTGVDVNVYSTGKYAHLFRGNKDNTNIAKAINKVLKQNQD